MRGARSSPTTLLVAVAAGLALADTSIVTLALPELLVVLDTTVEGVAAVLGVYTVVLAVAVLAVERIARVWGPARTGAAGALVFAVASALCGAVSDLVPLLVLRGVQAAGGAAVLLAAFSLLNTGHSAARGRALWLGAAVLSAAVGPAVGGALTEAFSWRSIFLVQAPVALAAAVALWREAAASPQIGEPVAEDVAAGGVEVTGGTHPGRVGIPGRTPAAPALALALVSAALSAVLFLLVLLLVAGWAVAPLEAALAVTVVPAAALVGSRLAGDARVRASAGCALVGGGVLALAFLPDADLLWTVPPQVAAGLGMGLALPALGGDLLPERDERDAARLLSLRHAGIAVALVALAPIVANEYEDATQRARERGVALVLDAKLPPLTKVDLAPALLGGVDTEAPRRTLEEAIAAERDFDDEAERAEYDRMAERADEVLVSAVGEAFRTAFLVTGALAVLAALVVLPWGLLTLPAAALCAGLLLAAGYGIAHDRSEPAAVVLQDPCGERELPGTGGVGGFLQDRALELLDQQACRYGSSREELVLALADGDDAERFERRYGTNPRSLGGLIDGLLGG